MTPLPSFFDRISFDRISVDRINIASVHFPQRVHTMLGISNAARRAASDAWRRPSTSVFVSFSSSAERATNERQALSVITEAQ